MARLGTSDSQRSSDLGEVFANPPSLAEVISQFIESSRDYAYQTDLKMDSQSNRIARLEKLIGRKPSAGAGDLAGSSATAVGEIRCGDIALPLKEPASDLARVLEEYFEVAAEEGATVGDLSKTAVRLFLALEEKAASGAISDEEMAQWQKLCQIVDRDALYRRRKVRTPVRRFGEVCLTEDGERAVQWSSASMSHLDTKARSALKFLDDGEWFEADVFQDADDNVVALSNVRPRPDYEIATDEEVAEFFRGQ